MIARRVRQFLEAGRQPDDRDLSLAREWLAPPFLDIYLAQHPRDATHTAATARWLLARGVAEPNLIRAALLHDVGKGPQRRMDRVTFVVAATVGAQHLLGDQNSRFEFRRAIHRSTGHASRGAAILKNAGADERVVELVRGHHGDPGEDVMLSLLQDADRAT